MMKQRGFTIVELMIATLVFSVVLLLLTTGLMQIGRTYSKGVSMARTQEVARSVADDVVQAIQFAGGTIIPTNGTMNNGIVSGACIGNKRYSVALTRQYTATSHNRFVTDTIASGCRAGPGGTTARSDGTAGTGMTGPLTGGGQELLGERMRVVDFRVTQSATNPNVYNVLVRVAYGDDDLLCSPALAGDCNANGVSPGIAAGARDLQCKNLRAGTQFCAISEISTTAVKRL
jgi:prepilin-type N-terminal cleavage/methylation domain-containing protein